MSQDYLRAGADGMFATVNDQFDTSTRLSLLIHEAYSQYAMLVGLNAPSHCTARVSKTARTAATRSTASPLSQWRNCEAGQRKKQRKLFRKAERLQEAEKYAVHLSKKLTITVKDELLRLALMRSDYRDAMRRRLSLAAAHREQTGTCSEGNSPGWARGVDEQGEVMEALIREQWPTQLGEEREVALPSGRRLRVRRLHSELDIFEMPDFLSDAEARGGISPPHPRAHAPPLLCPCVTASRGQRCRIGAPPRVRDGGPHTLARSGMATPLCTPCVLLAALESHGWMVRERRAVPVSASSTSASLATSGPVASIVALASVRRSTRCV